MYVAPERVLRTTMGFNLHRGIVASAHRTPLPEPESLLAKATRVAVLERLNDHENLGSLFRNARAFGLDAVLLDPQTADPLYRRCVRVSMGHVLRVPFARFTAWPDGIDTLQRHGFTVVALTPSPGALPIDEIAASPPEKIAIVLGAEGPGPHRRDARRRPTCACASPWRPQSTRSTSRPQPRSLSTASPRAGASGAARRHLHAGRR